uniref:Mitogen-activated protein kinase kinase kinase 2 n=1 Tax=Magallana gigas TaxID=29159 RepID=K1QB25_MAGGI
MLNRDTKESDLKYANLTASCVMTVNQPTQLSQLPAHLSIQYSKSAEEHNGDLGKEVGVAHPLSLEVSLHSSKELSSLNFEDLSKELYNKLSDTKDSEPKAEREVDHDDALLKRSADADLEDEKENDCEKDVSSNPHALYKSMSGLREDIKLAGPEKYKGRRSKRRIQPCVCPFFKASIIVLTCAGKGDKFVCPSPGDSEGERKNSGEDPPFSERGPKLRRGPSNDLSGKSRAVDPNFKYRRKHGKLRNGQHELSDYLGILQNLDQDIPPDLMLKIKDFIEDINPCLVICLRSQSGNDLENCDICPCLMALTSHFGSCNSEVQKCNLCTQLFRLVQQHVLLCRARSNDGAQCPVLVCRKISFLINEDPRLIFTKEAKIWRKLKKYIGGFIQRKEIAESKADDGETFFSMTSLTSINPGTSFGFQGIGNPVNPPAPSKRPSWMYMPSLTIIPEDQDRSLNVQENIPQPPPERVSRSEPILKKRPDGTIEALRPIDFRTPKLKSKALNRFASSEKLPIHPPSPVVTGPPPSFTMPKNTTAPGTKLVRKVSFRNERAESLKKALDVESDAFPDSSTGVAVESEESVFSSEPSSLEKTYGGQLKSVKEGSNPFHFGETQFLSLKEKPTGSPGIGEVVYGYRDILLAVLDYWEVLRQQYKEYGKLLQRSVKEEGVIYPDCKKILMIMGHRYQKDFQWVRMTHLGRGMFGNCHLASDYNTEYQFCIKKIHISKYREDEIKIWSDLEHPNIVRFHGALRRKEKIYILAEFIPADNILLREDGREIVLADFGVARRQTTKVSGLVGTPTHFSPEKAESSGHNYKSDLWASVCVLLHILSGDPPWVKRYPNATALQFLIATKPAPLEDIPHNIYTDVRNLIEQGLEKKPINRPTALALLQHHAFQLVNERGDNLYSVLPSGNLTEDDTHLPSSRLTGQTQEILEEIEESINHPEKIEEIFNNRLVLCDDITSILGKSQKVEDASAVTDKDFQLQTILQNGSFTQDFPPSSSKEATAVSLRIPGTVVEQGQGDFKSRENSFYLESLKKSTLATQEDILSDSIKDPSELITQYLYDDLILNHFPFQETNLTVLPLYVEDETAPNHLDTTVTGEVQIPESPNNIPMFESILSNETEIERLHTKVLLEQLSKTSSNSDLLAAASPSPQFNSGSQGGSSDFNQDHIIQTLMEKPENDSEAPSSSARSESTSNRSRNSSTASLRKRPIKPSQETP